YSVRSERMLMEQLQYNLLFRWFVGLNMDDEVWNATTFRNRGRVLPVDGTMVEGWARLKSFQPKDEAERGHDGGSAGTGARQRTLVGRTFHVFYSSVFAHGSSPSDCRG